MYHSYSNGGNRPSADRALWERSKQVARNRLDLAMKAKDSSDDGVKANALLVLSTYYRGGWCDLEQNSELADEYLKEAAHLGHSRACYEYARRLLGNGDKESALDYAKKGIEKISDSSFDSSLTAHNQKSMEDMLNGIKKVCEINFRMN